MADRARFQLIRGGRGREVTRNGIRVATGPRYAPPFAVAAEAVEDDTYFVLGADPRARPSDEHPIRAMTAALEAGPAELGSVVVKDGRPLRLLAVVHDLSAEPTCHEEWVAKALDGIFREAKERELEAVGLPLLGTRHGTLPADRFMVLLREALERAAPGVPERLWLIAPEDMGDDLLKILELG